MVKVFSIDEGVYQITVEEAPQPSSEVYFIAEEKPALVETGPSVIADSILQGLGQLGCELASLCYIFLTHIHMDHAGGAGHLMQQLPMAKVVVHYRGAQHLSDPARLIAGTRQAFGGPFEDRYGTILPVPEERIHAVGEGDVISLGGRKLMVIESPGHAPHHICFYEPDKRWLFCGEALGAYFPEGGAVAPAASAPGFDLESELRSAEKLRRLSPSILFYSHHGVGRNTEALMEQFEQSTKACAQVVLQAMRAGEEPEQVCRRVRDYLLRTIPDISLWGVDAIDRVAEGYMSYFERRNIA
jgi:glyoxylase-like metal-dependent hydrolase (beta-lactamase superfamily II)